MDRDVLELWLSKPHIAPISNSAAKLRRLSAQVQKERDHYRALSEKTSLYIDANGTSLYLSPPTASASPYRTEPQTHDIAHLQLAISHTSLCLVHPLTARRRTIRDNFLLSFYSLLQRLKWLSEIPPHITSSGNTVRLPPLRLKLHGKMYPCRDVRC